MSAKRYLYVQSASFNSNGELAAWLKGELEKDGLSPSDPIDEEYMQVISLQVDGENVDFFAGKTEEQTDPPTWLIWPQVRAGFWKKLTRSVNYGAEQKAREVLARIADGQGFTRVEWDDI